MSDSSGYVVNAAWGGPDAGVMGYDPWGARRNPSGVQSASDSFNLQVGHREFTGHEGIPNLGLVNMNGRVYDPSLGRFLSADPTVQFNANLQSYNRYSYVLNNPLRYTDPTGYSVFGSGWVDTVIFTGIAIVGAVGCPATAGAGCAITFGLIGAVLSSTSALSNGASLSQVGLSLAIGAIGSAAGGAIGGAVVGQAPATAGGAMLSGAISGAAANVISSVIVGGSLDGRSILMSAASGAVISALSWSVTSQNPVSEASRDEAQGGGGSGARQIESDATGAAVSGGDDSGGRARTELKVPLGAKNIRYQVGSDGTVHVTFELGVGEGQPTTTYSDGAGPDTPHATDGTLGAHEGRHAASLKDWWDPAHVKQIVRDEGMSTSIDLPAGTTPTQAKATVGTQLQDMRWTLSNMSDRFQATMIDGRPDLMVPFVGVRTETWNSGF